MEATCKKTGRMLNLIPDYNTVPLQFKDLESGEYFHFTDIIPKYVLAHSAQGTLTIEPKVFLEGATAHAGYLPATSRVAQPKKPKAKKKSS